MKKTLVKIELFADPTTQEAGIAVKCELPRFEEQDANEQMEIVKDKLSEVGHLLSDILGRYELKKCNTCDDCKQENEQLDDAVKLAKNFGMFAEMALNVMGDVLSEEDRKTMNQMIATAELAKFAEKLANGK